MTNQNHPSQRHLSAPLVLAFNQSPSSSQDAESEGWLVSYLDVFILIIALLVIMLIKSTPVESAPSELDTKELLQVTTAPTDNSYKLQLMMELEEINSDDRLKVSSNKKQINVRLGDTLLFDSSKARLKPEGKHAIKQLVPILKRLNKPIIVEGHSDNRPINTPLYPSNWELAAARANSVLHFLILQGIPKQHLSTINYADTQPIVPNDSHSNRSINRRVNLLIPLTKDA